MALSACSTGGLRPQSTALQPARLRAEQTLGNVALSPAAWPRSDWWSSFGDPQLDRIVAEALADSPTLRTAEARVRTAQAMEAAAGASLLPNVSGSMSTVEHHYSANGTTPSPVRGTWQTVYEGNLAVGYELDFWSKNRAALDAAIGRTKAAEIDGQATRLMLASAIVQAYASLQTNFEQRAIEEDYLRQQESIADLTRRRARAELGDQVDIEQAQAAIPAARAQISALSEQIELDRNRLAALLGKGPDRGRDISPPAMNRAAGFALPSRLPAELLGRRPDIVAQRWRVEAASREIDVAKARFYPNINLGAMVGLQSLGLSNFFDLSSGTAGIGPAISLPIFQGGGLRAGLAASDAAYDLAVESYNTTLIDALRDIADQLTGLNWLDRRLAEQQDAVATATRTANLVRHRYAAGLATYLQVLATQSAVLQQRRQLVALQMRGLSLQANLSRALGGGFIPDPDVPNLTGDRHTSNEENQQ
ncbi:efflux transporter outer membrane subunit [Sphingomonas sp. H39-1-10]|uniref:efflux transporter outer membrane subunit n=1 Tax=Sphingomonas pollutisoli TaxID=3030829 RepID=UPI0023BA0CCF|nr:efflux transporter outer membrane subunit [Sphingomonas pollutisoli]MDF0490353.1 efflux transporter outer membrane subunit [Sphingomonas pollutisoli]